MKDIPSDIAMRFREMLKRRSVPSGMHSYYLKWLRYYMDFCLKYKLSEKSSKSLSPFLMKLKEKKQTEAYSAKDHHV